MSDLRRASFASDLLGWEELFGRLFVLQEPEAAPASSGRGSAAQRCPFVCLKGSRINGRIFWGMALTSRSGTSINHVAARLLASLPVAFVSGAGNRGRRGGLSIYSQMSVRAFTPAGSWRWVKCFDNGIGGRNWFQVEDWGRLLRGPTRQVNRSLVEPTWGISLTDGFEVKVKVSYSA